MRFQETKKHIKFLVALNDHIVMEKGGRSDLFKLLVVVCCFAGSAGLILVEIVDLNVLVILLQLDSSELFD